MVFQKHSCHTTTHFILDEFKEVSRHWNFTHLTSSLTYSQSNGKVEAAVKSAKTVMKKSRKDKTDPVEILYI